MSYNKWKDFDIKLCRTKIKIENSMQKITCFIVTLCFEEIAGSSRERNFADFFKSNHNIISRFFKNSKTLIHALRHIL